MPAGLFRGVHFIHDRVSIGCPSLPRADDYDMWLPLPIAPSELEERRHIMNGERTGLSWAYIPPLFYA